MFIDELIKKMTLQEKVGQMYQAAHAGSELVGPQLDSSDTAELVRKGSVGSVLSVSDKEILRRLQEIAVNESRLGIPLL